MDKNKLKVIVFGIGTSCKDYLELYSNDYNILALCDWDKSTHGTKRYGFDIINPEDFEKYNYDKILILSVYVSEIRRQLHERLNINDEKIIEPPKYKIKGRELPFKDIKTLNFARELLIYFNNIAKDFNFDMVIDFGTLLGLTREGDILKKDDDIDFAILEKDREKLENMLVWFSKNQYRSTEVEWHCELRKDKKGNIWLYRLVFQNKHELKYKSFSISFGLRKVFAKNAFCMYFKFLASPICHFEKCDTLSWNGNDIKAPFNHKEYLDLLYGNWLVPQEYSFGSYYGTSYKGEIDDIKVELTDGFLF